MSNSDKRIKNILIVGGGTAGWMTAAALSNALQQDCKITLVESDAIGTIGVGEATIPPIRTFNQSLGIDENDFIRHTQGTFKLGIEFTNWAKLNHRYFHPFGTYGKQFDTVDLHQYWHQAHSQGIASKLDDYCMAWAAAAKGRFSPPVGDPRNVLSTYAYAYHFDAGLYAKYLRRYAEQKGVERIEGMVNDVLLNSDTGFVEGVQLKNGNTLTADLFIDCSGMKALLIEGALKTGFQDWAHWLPCDSAWAAPSKSNEVIKPYTRSTAHSAGWQWKIPLQHRTGNGHVFSSKFMDDDTAKQILLDNIEGELLAEPKLIKYKTGRRNLFWNKNVVSIGLSSGFLEPLESTSIHLIQAGISKLLALFPNKDFNQLTIDEYNHVATNEIENIRDFLILHYCLTERNDSDFWQYCAAMDIPSSLQYKIDQFKTSGRLITREMELFGKASWLAVHIGQLNFPIINDPLMQYRKTDATTWLNKLKEAMAAAAVNLPTHEQYIDRHCKSQNK